MSQKVASRAALRRYQLDHICTSTRIQLADLTLRIRQCARARIREAGLRRNGNLRLTLRRNGNLRLTLRRNGNLRLTLRRNGNLTLRRNGNLMRRRLVRRL